MLSEKIINLRDKALNFYSKVPKQWQRHYEELGLVLDDMVGEYNKVQDNNFTLANQYHTLTEEFESLKYEFDDLSKEYNKLDKKLNSGLVGKV